MSRTRYIFDAAQGVFRKSVTSISNFIFTALKYILAASALAVLWYIAFALLLSTDLERRLKAENRIYAEQYESMKEDVELLEAVVEGLELRDGEIYEGIFRNSVKTVARKEDLSDAENISDIQVSGFTDRKLESALEGAARVDAAFRRFFEAVDSGAVLPPLSAPVEDFSVKRAGASVGMRYSPFLGTEAMHGGLDIIGTSGAAVVAAADGTVLEVSRSLNGKGNAVILGHEGGYVTRYAHLGSISVRTGSRVRRGEQIGTIGMSGVSYAPHLHYEILRDSLVLDPALYMPASLSPEEYVELQTLARGSGQSLD